MSQLMMWISVLDGLPEHDEEVIIFDDFHVYTGFYFHRDYGFCCQINDKPHFCTHWMPLPEPPKQK